MTAEYKKVDVLICGSGSVSVPDQSADSSKLMGSSKYQAGVFAAAWLARYGVECTIIEKRDARLV